MLFFKIMKNIRKIIAEQKHLRQSKAPSQLKKGYYLAARKWHPDKNKDNTEAEACFKAVSDAWQVPEPPVQKSTGEEESAPPGELASDAAEDTGLYVGPCPGCDLVCDAALACWNCPWSWSFDYPFQSIRSKVKLKRTIQEFPNQNCSRFMCQPFHPSKIPSSMLRQKRMTPFSGKPMLERTILRFLSDKAFSLVSQKPAVWNKKLWIMKRGAC